MRRWLFLVLAAVIFSAGCGGHKAPTSLIQTYPPVTVDYSRPLAEMIAAGNYDWLDPFITEGNFPIQHPPAVAAARVKLEIVLVHFNRRLTSNEVMAEFRQLGLRPATLPELLAFGEQYPNQQRQYPIIALGSFCWDGDDQFMPYLWSIASDRSLYLIRPNDGWFEGGWAEYCRFLAVRSSGT